MSTYLAAVDNILEGSPVYQDVYDFNADTPTPITTSISFPSSCTETSPQTEEGEPLLFQIPSELIVVILLYSDPKDILHLALTCIKMKTLTVDVENMWYV